MTLAELLANVDRMSPFARTIYQQKYAHEGEDWPDTAYRVASNVLGALGYDEDSEPVLHLTKLISERKFMPGGRYLYAAGRSLHQCQNCLLLRAEDSREGWSELLYKASMALMTGAGIGIDYSEVRPDGSLIEKTGGVASGPISLMSMVNECGRHIMQGGARRSAIWAGLRWSHPDCLDFIVAKDWSPEVRNLKEKDFNHPAPLDMTNVSVLLDDEFFEAYRDEAHPKHKLAQDVYWKTTARMLKTAEPGFSIDIGPNAGETLRNAPIAGDTHVMTSNGYRPVESIANSPNTIWTGSRWVDNVVFKKTGVNVPTVKVEMVGGRDIVCDPTHEFLVERYIGAGKHRQLDSIECISAQNLKPNDILHISLPVADPITLIDSSYELGYIYGDGSFTKRGGAEVTFCTDESKAVVPHMVGANSINTNDGRGYVRAYYGVSSRFDDRSKDTFPTEVYSQTHSEIASFIAGLFDSGGNYLESQRRIRLASKHRGFLRGVARALEQLGIVAGISKTGTSTFGKTQGWQLVVMADYHDIFADVIPTQRIRPVLGDYVPYRRSKIKVLDVSDSDSADVYCADVKVAEHSFVAEGVVISNCTELVSSDDSDICNLGSINLARIDSIEEMEEVVEAASLFLLAGTVYSDLPYDKVKGVREKNRRLGLGLMGIHEWLLQRGLRYGESDELASWLDVYARSTEFAHRYADEHDLSRPVKTRALAPTGTIGILAETTTGIEPIFCVAYKRRYLVDAKIWKYQYVVDPTAQRIIDQTEIDPEKIEDAYTLSYDVERRVAFQAWVQQWVDHAISSTINLPYPITDSREVRDFGEMLLQYLPHLRGVTCYPDGARGGQPLTPVPYSVARGQEGVVLEEEPDRCVGGSCGV